MTKNKKKNQKNNYSSISIEFPFKPDQTIEFFSKKKLSQKRFYKLVKENDYFIIPQNMPKNKNEVYSIISTKSSKSDIDYYSNTNSLCHIIESKKDKTQFLNTAEIKLFKNKPIIEPNIYITYTKQDLETYNTIFDLKKNNKDENDHDDFKKKIKDEIVYQLNDKEMMFYSSYHAMKGDKLQVEYLGKNFNVVLEQENNLFVIKNIYQNKNNKNPMGYLMTDKISISLPTDSKENERLINELSQTGSEYLGEWKKYLHLEFEKLFESLKNVFSYTKIKRDEEDVNKYLIEIKGDVELIERNKDYVLSEKSLDKEITKELSAIEKDNENQLISTYMERMEKWKKWYSDNKNTFTEIKSINNSNDEFTIQAEKQIPEKGYIIENLNGNIVQKERHYKALEKLNTAGSKINHLIALLEGKPLTGLKTGNIKLSKNISDKIFEHGPNDSQKKAIELALNTPDIVLIQGPPGTGKTTVSRAIAEMSNKLADNKRMNVLFSAFQHDAVKNILKDTEINGFPIPKVGRQSNINDNEEAEISIGEWINEITDDIKKYHKDNPPNTYYEETLGYILSYIKNPVSNDELYGYLTKLYELYPSKKIDLLREEIATKYSEKNDMVKENMIYAIRTTKQGIIDDGILQLKLLENEKWIHNEDKNKIKKLAEKVFKKEDDITDDYITRIKALKKNLLSKYKQKKSLNIIAHNEDVIKLIKEIKLEIDIKKRKEYKPEDIIAELLGEINYSPVSIENAVLDYVAAIGSTTGQALGNSTISKLGYNEKDDYSFGTSIIDEAARATPLNLFGVMNITRNRIVLVGDHRQLPHILDEEIKRKLEKNEKVNEVDYLKLSFFEFLFTLLKKIEKEDGIKRVITLDKQYRMHKILGEFVSDTFFTDVG